MCQSVWLIQNICTNSKGMTFNVFRVVWNQHFVKKNKIKKCAIETVGKLKKMGHGLNSLIPLVGRVIEKTVQCCSECSPVSGNISAATGGDLFQDENRIRRLWAITKWCDDDSHAVPLLITRSSTPLCQRTSSPPSSKHQMVEEWTINVKMHWWSASGMLWLNI